MHGGRIIFRRPQVVGGDDLATWGFGTTGWTTFGITPEVGNMPAGTYAQIGALTTQTDVLATHDDGSARHALVTALIPSTGDRTITTSASGPGSAFTPSNWPTCVVDMTIEATSNWGTPGDVYRASLPSYSTTDRSCSGALLQETHYFVIPAKTVGGTPHPFLRVRFSVRSYSDGEHEVDVIGENVQLHKSGSTARAVDYALTIVLNGDTVLTKAARVSPFTVSYNPAGASTDYSTSAPHGLTKGDCLKITSGLDAGEVRVVHSAGSSTTWSAFYGLYNTVIDGAPVSGLTCTVIGLRHWAATRWVHRCATSDYVAADQVIDVDHYVAGKAFPKYLGNASASQWPLFNNVGVGPFGPGNWRLASLNGPDTGTRPDLGHNPGWVVSYLSHPSNQALRDVVLQEADLAGSYNLHYGVDDDNSLLDLDTYPTFWGTVNLANGGQGVAVEDDTTWYAGTPVVQFTVDFPHLPQPSHAAYVLTGRRYYADETKYIANTSMLVAYNDGGAPGYGSRGGGAGYVGQFFSAARGHAWGLRNLLCCYFLPDADPYKDYFETRIATNLSVADDYAAVSSAANAWGAIYYESYSPVWPEGGGPRPNWIVISPWQVFYMSSVAYWATQLYGAGDVLLDRICRFAMGFYNEPTIDEDHRSPYRIFTKYANADGDPFTFYDTLADAYADQVAHDTSGIFAVPMTSFYGPHVRMCYVLAKKIGLSNAQAAIDWIDAYDYHGASDLSVLEGLALGTMAFALHEDQ